MHLDKVTFRPAPRQAEIIGLIAGGLGTKEIAAQLGLSRHTVAQYIRRAMAGFGCHTRAELVARAVGYRSVPPANDVGAAPSSRSR